MKTIEELKNIIDRFYAKHVLTSEVENILLSCGASEDDSSDEGYFAGMTDSQIRTCYSKIRDLIRYHHENKNPDYFTEDTLIDFDLPDLVLEESFSIYEQMNKIDDKESLDEKYNVKNLMEQDDVSKKKKLSKNDIIYRYNFGLPMSEEDILKIGTVEEHKENAERIHDAVLAIKKWDPDISVSRKKDWTSMSLILRRSAKGGLTGEERNELKAVISKATNFKDVRVYGGDNYLRCNGFVSIGPDVREFINQ